MTAEAFPDMMAAVEEGQFDVVPITSRSVRLFLGYQIPAERAGEELFDVFLDPESDEVRTGSARPPNPRRRWRALPSGLSGNWPKSAWT